jgi:hypothetical protein
VALALICLPASFSLASFCALFIKQTHHSPGLFLACECISVFRFSI